MIENCQILYPILWVVAKFPLLQPCWTKTRQMRGQGEKGLWHGKQARSKGCRIFTTPVKGKRGKFSPFPGEPTEDPLQVWDLPLLGPSMTKTGLISTSSKDRSSKKLFPDLYFRSRTNHFSPCSTADCMDVSCQKRAVKLIEERE